MRRNRLFALVLASTMLWSTVGAKDVQSAEPENPDPENPDSEKPNPEKSESGKGEAVKTGDTANTVLWMMLVGISVSAMALTLRKGKVKR